MSGRGSSEPGMLGLSGQEWNIVIFIIIVGVILSLEQFIPGVYTGVWAFVKKLEIKTLLLFSPILTDEYETALRTILGRLEAVAPGTITMNAITRVEAETKVITSFIYGAVGFYCALKLFFRPRFDNPLNLEELIEQQTKTVWRFNRHLAKINPLRYGLDIRKGPYRIRQRPAHYCREHNLIRPKDEYEPNRGMFFDRDAAKVVFERQIDKEFTSFGALPRHQQYVAAGLICFLCEGLKPAVEYFGDVSCFMAKEFSKKKLHARTDFLLQEYADRDEVKLATKSHKYVSGVLRRLLKEGKNNGVVCTALFTWLLYTDRFLYLMLDDDGIPETSIECAYPATHYSEELRVGRRLDDDKMEHYIDELEKELRFYNVIS
ncbi:MULTISPECIES: secretion/conjugation apparatus DotM-related subunit [Aeromonas]|uniref:DotM C-terminal cytoplasmic domain-containing protein n=1 Tax=Aeromonas veronii TaxID=654 RepID=A0A4V3YZT8_AERVE|nr:MULTISPECIES: hypothetical protein [Aeromonas]THJ43662.1 hypothetical protein E8Q35_15260 [Aeromonas veronii]